MKRVGNLYKQVYNIQNLMLAHQNASKGKSWYSEVIALNKNILYYLNKIRVKLKNKTYKTSEYFKYIKTDGIKEREICKLPYFPDRICQWALLQIIEPYLVANLTKDTYSAIPNRGIHQALERLQKAMKHDQVSTQYCLKIDIKKYYSNIDQEILMDKFRRIFKDDDLIWLIGEIVSSTPKGIPIGNYLSQWCGNFYLSSFDHWIKEQKKIKYYFRYMDDMIIFHESKEHLHQLFKEIREYVSVNLKLEIKENWQVFPSHIRGVEFVGYRIFTHYTLLRKTTSKSFKRRLRVIRNKMEQNKPLTRTEWCSVSSYSGWLDWGDCHNLTVKYIHPVKSYLNEYYRKEVKRKCKNTSTCNQQLSLTNCT